MKDKKVHNIKKTGFKTPDTYFESIENRVITELNKDISLDKINDNGFKTSNNYFETIEDKVLTTLNEYKETKVISLFSRRNILYFSSISAVVVIMLGLFFDKTTGDFNDIDLEIVETYLEEQNLDTYDIASLLTEDDLSEDNFGIINDNFSEESLEDYLMDNTNLQDIIE